MVLSELNVHVPQSIEARAEVKLIASVKANLMSGQASKTLAAVVQDSLLALYLITKPDVKVDKETFFNICMFGDIEATRTTWSSQYIVSSIEHVRNVYTELGLPSDPFTGRGLLSLVLPRDFFYEKNTGGSPEEPKLKIYKGVIYEGMVTKGAVGTSHNCITQVLHKEYGASKAIEFVNNAQFIANAWLSTVSFSIGLRDCMTSLVQQQKIRDIVMKSFVDAYSVNDTSYSDRIKEMKINMTLNKAKDLGNRLAKENLDTTNNFISTVLSGSKGDFVNITQITGLLGQQNLSGKRFQPQLNCERRMLSHFPMMVKPRGKKTLIPTQKCSTIKELKSMYTSRGFIRHSFIEGLTPHEVFFHASSGREGVTNTACKTSESGYLQRRMVKLQEDHQVQQDSTVRNGIGNVIQLRYGDNGFDAAQLVPVKGKFQFCDAKRLAQKMNERKRINDAIEK